MWTIAKIEEADYGCEERLPGEPRMLLITLESEDGAAIQFEAAENWIEMQGLDEGDEWLEDLEDEDSDERKQEIVRKIRFLLLISFTINQIIVSDIDLGQ
jgi:hypothetical protein